jgi:long-chain acyl-CoA synthetase
LAASDEHLSLDYRSLHAVACGLAGYVAQQSDRPRVGILAPPSSACAAAILACWYAGRVPVPINFLLAPEELAVVVRDAEIDLALTIERFVPAAKALGLNALTLGPQTLMPGKGAAPDVAPGDLGALIYTSGTTGDPKGVCLSFENIARNIEASVEAAEIGPESVFLSLLPQFHAFGFTTNTLVPLLVGATVHYLPRFSPVTVVKLIEEKRVTVFITIASMFGALVAMKDARAEQFASLRLPVSGGEPLPARVAQAFEQRFQRRIYEGYGMTEASPVVTLNTHAAYRPGTVGRPLPGLSVSILDDDGREVPVGSDGQIVVRGHCVMQGYLNKPEATATAIRDGALWTGDIGHVDADGFMTITGRAKEMMIVGGENVFPVEIEAVLIDHPAVAAAAVIGGQDEIRGEVPVAFVMLDPGAAAVTEVALRSFCRERLAAYKVPRRVHIREDLPRGPTGKIAKRRLRAEGG